MICRIQLILIGTAVFHVQSSADAQTHLFGVLMLMTIGITIQSWSIMNVPLVYPIVRHARMMYIAFNATLDMYLTTTYVRYS